MRQYCDISTFPMSKTTNSARKVESPWHAKYYKSNSSLTNGKVEIPHCSFDSLLLRNEKVEISQYTKQGFPYVIGKTPKSFPFSAPKDKAVRRRKTRTIKAAVTGFPLFLAELVVFGIGFPLF